MMYPPGNYRVEQYLLNEGGPAFDPVRFFMPDPCSADFEEIAQNTLRNPQLALVTITNQSGEQVWQARQKQVTD